MGFLGTHFVHSKQIYYVISVEQILHGMLAEYYAGRNCQKLWIMFPSYFLVVNLPDNKIELAFTFIFFI